MIVLPPYPLHVPQTSACRPKSLNRLGDITPQSIFILPNPNLRGPRTRLSYGKSAVHIWSRKMSWCGCCAARRRDRSRGAIFLFTLAKRRPRISRGPSALEVNKLHRRCGSSAASRKQSSKGPGYYLSQKVLGSNLKNSMVFFFSKEYDILVSTIYRIYKSDQRGFDGCYLDHRG
jgi:hypothetical protein